MTNSAKATDYAKMLFDVAQEEKTTTEILYELNSLQNMRAKEVNRLLNIPIISKEVKIALIDHIKTFDISNYVINFMKVLVSRDDFDLFLEIIDEYKLLYQKKENIQIVNVSTAKKLSKKSIDILIKELENKLNKFIVISSFVNPALIGGIKIEYNGKEVDNTIKKHLDDFKNHLARS